MIDDKVTKADFPFSGPMSLNSTRLELYQIEAQKRGWRRTPLRGGRVQWEFPEYSLGAGQTALGWVARHPRTGDLIECTSETEALRVALGLPAL